MKKRLLFLATLITALSLTLFSGCSDKDKEQIIETIVEEVIEEVNTEEITEETIESDSSESFSITEDGEYSDPYEVAEYIYTFEHLPSNYITKDEAKDLGWVSSEGNLWDVAYGMSIGGDYFGNYEELLPDGDYRECDVNYYGGYRGSERLIFSVDDFSVYYTQDHYESFTQLY